MEHNPVSIQLVSERLHTLPLALIHGDHTIGACPRGCGTDHSNIYGRQAPIVKGASEDIGRAKPWM
jgi:hypothetical protein